ncbi:MAG: P63C domain-containing protein [Halieaceae bacterium]|nr:P63C domain-containing protein [Halieaceae bacterium]
MDTQDKNATKSAGGKARAAALTPEQRSEIAKNAAKERWGTDLPKADYVGELTIGDFEISCAVLPDGTRVLSQRGVGVALGRRPGGREYREAAGGNLPAYLAAKSINPFISNELLVAASTPIKYRHGKGGGIAFGVEVDLLPQILEVWLKARDAGALTTKPQMAVAERADILTRALAKVALVALVDEATGYQDVRARDALARILEAYIEKELQPWTKTFPENFYKEIFRLRGWNYKGLASGEKPRRPGALGGYTNDLVYERLAPGIYEELQKKNPKQGRGRKAHHHRWFTTEYGHPKLAAHIEAITALARVSSSWEEFKNMVERVYPKPGATIPMNL